MMNAAILFIALQVAPQAAPLAPAPPPRDDLKAALESIRAKHDLPALGGAIVTVDGLEEIAATGVRSLGKDRTLTAADLALVTAEDQWHLGSCTKAMTATLIALLVERGEPRSCGAISQPCRISRFALVFTLAWRDRWRGNSARTSVRRS